MGSPFCSKGPGGGRASLKVGSAISPAGCGGVLGREKKSKPAESKLGKAGDESYANPKHAKLPASRGRRIQSLRAFRRAGLWECLVMGLGLWVLGGSMGVLEGPLGVKGDPWRVLGGSSGVL